MKTKKYFKIFVSLVFIFVIFLQTNILISSKHINAQEVSPSSSDSESSDPLGDSSDTTTMPEKEPLDLEKVRNDAYAFLEANFQLQKDDIVPDDLWQVEDLDGNFYEIEKINNAIFSSLGVSGKADITVKHIVENITALDLSDFGSSSLPPVVFFMASLNELDLSYNSFGILDFSGSFLKSLKKIDVSYNSELQGIGLFDLNYLEEINLHHCAFVNDSIISIEPSSVIKLDLSGNRIQAFSITNMQRLEELILDDGILRFLEVTTCPNIQTISAKKNKLSAINFADLSNLKKLDLSNNYLSTVPDLATATSLSSGEINFSNNQIASLPAYLSDIGITNTIADFSDNLLDIGANENQKKLVSKDGISITVEKDFNFDTLQETLLPYLAMQSSSNASEVKAISPNLDLKLEFEQNDDIAAVLSSGQITKDFSANLTIGLVSTSLPEGLGFENSKTSVNVNFKSSGDTAKVSIEGDPYDIISATSTDKTPTTIKDDEKSGTDNVSSDNTKNNSTSSGSSSSDQSKSSTSDNSSSANTTSSKSNDLPYTGNTNYVKMVFFVLIISITIAILIASISLLIKKNKQ